METFTIKDIEKMAEDLTIKTPRVGDRIHNGALQLMVDRAKILVGEKKEEKDLKNTEEVSNVVSINKNKTRRKKK